MTTADVNGFELYYEEHGEGEPIVFHHQFAGSHHAWAPIAERLRDRYRCILMDARGAGDSGRPDGGYDIAQYAADVIGLADHLGLERFTYVGHSMGGGVGMLLGLDYPERLSRLVLVTPLPADGIQMDEAAIERSRRLRAEGARDVLMRERSAGLAREEAIDAALVERLVQRALAVSDGHIAGGQQSMREFRVGDRLPGLTTPTLMIAAAADRLIEANLIDFMRLPNATLHVFSRVAHGVPEEVPSALSRVLADFMEHGVVNAATLQERLQLARTAP